MYLSFANSHFLLQKLAEFPGSGLAALSVSLAADFSSSQKWKIALDLFLEGTMSLQKMIAAEDLTCISTLVGMLKKNKFRTVVVCTYNCISFIS